MCQNRHIPCCVSTCQACAEAAHGTPCPYNPGNLRIKEVGTRRAESGAFRVCDNNKRMCRFRHILCCLLCILKFNLCSGASLLLLASANRRPRTGQFWHRWLRSNMAVSRMDYSGKQSDRCRCTPYCLCQVFR